MDVSLLPKRSLLSPVIILLAGLFLALRYFVVLPFCLGRREVYRLERVKGYRICLTP